MNAISTDEALLPGHCALNAVLQFRACEGALQVRDAKAFSKCRAAINNDNPRTLIEKRFDEARDLSVTAVKRHQRHTWTDPLCTQRIKRGTRSAVMRDIQDTELLQPVGDIFGFDKIRGDDQTGLLTGSFGRVH